MTVKKWEQSKLSDLENWQIMGYAYKESVEHLLSMM